MPPKFRKSISYLRVSSDIETEVIDAYSETIDATGNADLFLVDVPNILSNLRVPSCFSRDVSECIEWFYATRKTPQMACRSINWPIAEQLLRHLTISTVVRDHFDVSDIVDLDKLVKFCCRLLKFRDSYADIRQNWGLFVESSHSKSSNNDRKIVSDPSEQYLTLQDLVRVKSALQLDDISDSILIDMLGCGQTTVQGDVFNYKLASGSVTLHIGIKDFAEVLGWLGHYDA